MAIDRPVKNAKFLVDRARRPRTPSKSGDTRGRLVSAADRLFRQEGYQRSALADVAKEAGVPLGNVYYYFKTKDELVNAVIERRDEHRVRLVAEVEALPDPRQRLLKFVEQVDESIEERTLHGCPVGGLCQEANRVGGSFAERAGVTFRRRLEWLERQFAALGTGEPRVNAVHVLASIQGAILLAHTFRDAELLRGELRRLGTWLGELGPLARARAVRQLEAGARKSTSKRQERK